MMDSPILILYEVPEQLINYLRSFPFTFPFYQI